MLDSYMANDSSMSMHSSDDNLNNCHSSNFTSHKDSGRTPCLSVNSSCSEQYEKSGFDLHSLEDFPYNSGTLEMLLEAVNQEYEVDTLESENHELKKKVIELESNESMEREKLRKQEDYLRTKLQQKRSEAQNLKEKRIYQNIENDEMRIRIQEEKKRLKTYKEILKKEMDAYDKNRSKLNEFTTDLHDRIRFKTAGMKMESDISLSICGIEIMLQIPNFIKAVLKSPRRRRFYCSLIKRVCESMELLFSTLFMFAGLLLLLYLSGSVYFQCNWTLEKGSGDDMAPADGDKKEDKKSDKPGDDEGSGGGGDGGGEGGSKAGKADKGGKDGGGGDGKQAGGKDSAKTKFEEAASYSGEGDGSRHGGKFIGVIRGHGQDDFYRYREGGRASYYHPKNEQSELESNEDNEFTSDNEGYKNSGRSQAYV